MTAAGRSAESGCQPSTVGTTRQGEEAPRHPIREDPVRPQRGQGLRGLVIRFQKGDWARDPVKGAICNGLSTKSGQKGDSWGAKGFGKRGYKGSCFRCGQ